MGESPTTGVNGTLGFDYSFADDQAFIGGALSYQTGKAELGGVANQRVEADPSASTSMAAYAARVSDRLCRLLGARPTICGAKQRSAHSSHPPRRGSPVAKMGPDVDVGNGTITPHVGIDAMWISIDGRDRRLGGDDRPDRTTALIDGRIGVTYKGLYDGARASMPVPSDRRLCHRRAERRQRRDHLVPRLPASVPMTFVSAERDNGWVEYEAGLEYEATNFGLALNTPAPTTAR